MAAKSEILSQVIETIVNAVNLHHLDSKSLTADTSLRDGGLELDSVDILEVIVAIEQQFGVKVADSETGKTYFRTLGTVADFVLEKGSKG